MNGELQVNFLNRRSQRLYGVLHLPRSKAKPPAVIIAHGFTDDKTGDNRLFVKFARAAVKRGFAVLRFDFAGSGDSEGDFSRVTVGSEIADLKCAVDFLCASGLIDKRRLSLIGYSLGGAVAVIEASRDQRIRSVIGWAPVARPLQTFKRVLGARSFLRAKTETLIACSNGDKQFFLRKEFFASVAKCDPASMIGKISYRPILIIQGSEDKKVLPEDAGFLFRRAGEPREIRFIKGSGHNFAYFEDELFGVTLSSLTLLD